MNKRSPFFYVGDKYKLMPQLLNLFPIKIGRLIEPFCGGGSVFLNTPSNSYIANDKNSHMINLHIFLMSYADKREKFFDEIERLIKYYGLSASYLNITVPIELKKQFVKTHYAVYNKNAYEKLRLDFNNNKSDMFRLYLLLIYGFNHMLRFNRSGNFNLPVGNVDYNKNVYNSLNDYFDFILNNKISFHNEDYETFIKKLKLQCDDFVYFDPPYLISDSEYNKNWTQEEEIRLLKLIDWLNSNNIKFALSNVMIHKGRENSLLIEWSKKYKVIEVKSNYISYHDNTIKNTKEVLITNYE